MSIYRKNSRRDGRREGFILRGSPVGSPTTLPAATPCGSSRAVPAGDPGPRRRAPGGRPPCRERNLSRRDSWRKQGLPLGEKLFCRGVRLCQRRRRAALIGPVIREHVPRVNNLKTAETPTLSTFALCACRRHRRVQAVPEPPAPHAAGTGRRCQCRRGRGGLGGAAWGHRG